MPKKTIVMSVGGSLISPNAIDVNFLIGFRKVILNFIKKGNRVIIITGGGDTARSYQKAARQVNRKVSLADLDWIGIAATKVNAELVRAIFGSDAHQRIIINPGQAIRTNKKVLTGGGYEPGMSSDADAVIIAKTHGAKTIINLSNITYVYDKDPKKYKNAKPQKEMTWKEFRKLVGNVWVPGAHLPFDPVASRMAAQAKMRLVIMKGNDLKNVENFLQNKPFIGTVIS